MSRSWIKPVLGRVPWWIFVTLLGGALVLLAPNGRAARRQIGLGVASEHPLSTRAALEMLADGGNAVDAAAAAALVAGVVNPSSSGIGGGGFVLVHRPGDSEPLVLDFRETAPAALDPLSLERRKFADDERGLLVGVPGEVAGLYELVRRFGRKPWSAVVAPAERVARRGFAVGAHLARTLRESPELRRDARLSALFFPRGAAAVQGRVVSNEKLGNTLKRIAAEGPSAFYDGSIAAEIVATARQAGSALTATDLRDYRVKERRPLRFDWAEHQIYTMPPPSAGGILLAQTLGMLSREELVRLGHATGAYQHLLAEAFRAALADRLRFAGDPDHVGIDVAKLLDPARLARRRAALSIDRTHALPVLAREDHGTHHLIVADALGFTVSLTTTVNRAFGAQLVTPESGIVLNDELGDFTPTAETDALGIPTRPNAPRALARPVSSMTPTLAFKGGRAVLAVGGSGGMAIPTNVTQVVIGRLAFEKPAEALVRAPRFYVFPRGPTMMLEAGASRALVEDLAFRGERIAVLPSSTSAVQLVTRDATGIQAAADPRKFGRAEVR